MPVGGSWVPLAAAGLSAGGSLLSGWMGSNAAKSAAEKQQQMAMQIYQMQQANLAPYMNMGMGAFSTLGNLFGTGGGDAQKKAWEGMLSTPAYKFALEQGQLGLERAGAAKGLLLSGGQLKDAMQFNQGLASQQIGNYTNALSSMAGIGANSAMGGSNMLGNTLSSGANAGAAGDIGGANAWMKGLQGAGNNLLMGYGLSRPWGGQVGNPSVYNLGTGGMGLPSGMATGGLY